MIGDQTTESARREEWRAVAGFLECTSVEPCALVIEGEAGIGKTTFWFAACEHARSSGFQVLSARGSPTEAVLTYAALADLLSGVQPDVWAGFPNPQRSALDRIALRCNDDVGPADQRTVAAAFLAVIERLTTDRTVILAVDDSQWLDPSSSLVLGFAMRRLSRPTGVLATLRTGPTENHVGWLQLARPDAVQRVSLPPMKLGALHHVVSQRLGRFISRPEMVRIHQMSGGNPFYAIELARMITADAAGGDVRLPDTLSDLVQDRLMRLRVDVRNLLLATACLARPTVELLTTALSIGPEELDTLLEVAETAGILVLEGHRIRFSHPLLGTGAYTNADPSRRRAMHRRLAEVVDEPELRARHLALAATRGEPATLESLDSAAEMARVRGAPAAAAELLELAIGLGGDTAQRRIPWARLLFNSGDSVRARDILERVVEEPAPPTLHAEALSLLAVMSQLEGNLLDGADELERALGVANHDLRLRVGILVSLAWIYVHVGDSCEAAQCIDDALAGARRLNDPQLLGQALGMSTVVHMLLGDGVQDQFLRAAMDLPAANEAATVMFRPVVHDALVSSWCVRPDDSQAKFSAIRRRCVERGEESELVFITFHQVLNEAWRANYRQAAVIAEDAVERARLLCGPLPLGAALTVRALLAAYAGRVQDARRDLADAAVPMRQCGSALLAAWTSGVLGFLEVSLGNYQTALEALGDVVTRISAAPRATEISVAWSLPDAIEAMINLGHLDDAAPLVAALQDNGDRLDRPWMSAVGARGRGMLLAARGDIDGAMRAVDRALRHHDRLPMPFERARTLMLCAQLQRRQRRKQESARTMREALAAFEQLRTPLWVDRARAELERSPVGRRRGAGLTPSEQRVAELVVSGLTNRDVAANLFISSKTVEADLGRIYRKLGIHSRVELAAHLQTRR